MAKLKYRNILLKNIGFYGTSTIVQVFFIIEKYLVSFQSIITILSSGDLETQSLKLLYSKVSKLHLLN